MGISKQVEDSSEERDEFIKRYESKPETKEQYWRQCADETNWNRETARSRLMNSLRTELEDRFGGSQETINICVGKAFSTDWQNKVITEYVSNPTKVPYDEYIRWLNNVSIHETECKQHFSDNALKAIRKRRKMLCQREVSKETQQTAPKAEKTPYWQKITAIVTAVASIVKLFT